MRQMTRKTFSIITIIAMLVAMLPGMAMPVYADDAVAMIGETSYTSLQAAFDAAADEDTVQLVADITVDSGFTLEKAGCEIALDLNNHFINVTGEYENAITVIKGTLKLEDSTIGGSATEHCYYIDFSGSHPIGVVTDSADSHYVNADVKGTFTGGYISACSSGIGLKVYTNDAKGVVMESGTIIGCGYSGINAEGGGDVTMTGGLLVGNYNDCFAGGVVVHSYEDEDEGVDIPGHFEMSGGKIVNNYGDRYGGVKLGDANAVLSGDITISDNYWYGGSGDDEHGPDNLLLNHSRGANDMVELGSLAATARIGIRIDAGEDVGDGVFTTGAGSTENAAAAVSNGNFTSDDGYPVSQVAAGTDAGQLQLKAPAVAKNVTQNEEYATLQKALNAANSGDTVVLLKSVKENVVFGKNNDFDGKTVTLNLKGFYIDGSKNRGLSAINVKYGNLVLTDDTTGEHFYYIDESTHLGVIDDTKATAGYTGASVHGSFRGGYVTGADSASGINVDNNCGGSLTLNGGAVIGNKAQYRGGGICAGGVFTMNGGYVVGNYASNNYLEGQPNGGGGIVAYGKGVKLLGGIIMHNTTASESHGGGGVLAFKNGTSGINTTVGGNVKIQENWSFNGSKVNNLTVWKYSTPNNTANSSETLLLLENPASGMKVGVTIFEAKYQGGWTTTPDAIGVFTDGVGLADARAAKRYFTSDNSAYGVKVNSSTDGELAIGEVTFRELESVTITNSTEAARNGAGGEATYPLVGDVLTANAGGATSVTYQWYRVKGSSAEAITKESDATYGKSVSYTATADDVGYTLKVEAIQFEDENGALSTPVKENATIGIVALLDAPTSFTVTPTTYPNSTDGQIEKNSTAADATEFTNLRYSADGGETWHSVQTDGKTSASDNLKAGTYLYKYVDAEGKTVSKNATVKLEAAYDLIGLKITSTNQNFYDPDRTNTLTAVPEFKTGSPVGTQTYTWWRISSDGIMESDPIGSTDTYVVTADDVGCTILAALEWNSEGFGKRLSTPTPEIIAVPANRYEISGKITRATGPSDTVGTACSGATVELRQGNTVIVIDTADGSGNYTFSQSVPNGDYNIVVGKDDVTMTRLITVDGGNITNVNVLLPYLNVSSKVVVQGNVPAIVVGSLDNIAATQSDGVAGPGTSVDVKLTVEGKEDLTTASAEKIATMSPEELAEKNDQSQVKNLAQQKTGSGAQVEFLNMDMTMSVSSGGNTTVTNILDTGSDLARVFIGFDSTGKYNVGLFRKHVDENGQETVQQLVRNDSHAEGTYQMVDKGIDTYVGKFSTYAIAYTTTAPKSGKSSGGAAATTEPAIQPAPTPAKVASPQETGVADWLITDDHIAYLSGYDSDGVKTIRPTGNITRAEVAMIFYRLLLDKNPAAEKNFTDVKDGAWYATAVRVLASKGIISGYAGGDFRPNDQITRAEFAAIATRFAKAVGGKVDFVDVKTGHWAYSNIATAAKYGWVNGYSDGSFAPSGKITRAEVATIVNHMLGRVADEAYIKANPGKIANFTDLQSGKWYYLDMVEAANAHSFETLNGAEAWK